jgi:hypothetical protein
MRYSICSFFYLVTALLLAGCAITQASQKLEGADLKEIVALENFQGCIYANVTGSYIGAAGQFRIIGSIGRTNTVQNCIPGAILAP